MSEALLAHTHKSLYRCRKMTYKKFQMLRNMRLHLERVVPFIGRVPKGRRARPRSARLHREKKPLVGRRVKPRSERDSIAK